MPPKRKAVATVDETRSAQPRPRTRSAAADSVEVSVAELPPAKRTRRHTQREDGPTLSEKAPGRISQSRATHAGARGRKAEAGKEAAPEPQPNAPTRRGRGKETEEAEETHSETPIVPAGPLEPVQERTAVNAPKKRARPKSQNLDELLSGVVESSRPKQARRAKSPAQVTSENQPNNRPLSSFTYDDPPPLISQEASPSTSKKRSTRKAVVPTENVQTKVASPSMAPATLAPECDAEKSSDDELLLTPSKRVNVRPSTPTRTTGSRVGTPRIFLHSVEITPRRVLNAVRRDLGSPTPRAPGHLPLKQTPRLPAAFPSVPGSPTKPAPPPSASRSRAVRTPSPQSLTARLPRVHPPEAPSRPTRRTAVASPEKEQRTQMSSEELPKVLPQHWHTLLERQKRAILQSLQRPPDIDEVDVYGEDYPPTNVVAYEQLGDLLTGTVVRGEGNSCLLIGPSGSGKTQTVDRAIAALPSKPVVVRLSGYAQHNDRLAIREIAWQLAQQTGQSFLPSESEDPEEDGQADAPVAVAAERDLDDDDNPFDESAPPPAGENAVPVVTLPPPAHLLALISMIPTLPRPTIVVLDGFELFASHARQALLYCLLDTAQACRTGTGSGSGMAVVGVTARVDTINILEKRVKSRFSGRMIRTACPAKMEHWVELAKAILGAPIVGGDGTGGSKDEREWAGMWRRAVEKFVGDEDVVEVLRETYALTRDFQMFRRIMTSLVLELSPYSPYPTLAKLETSSSRQRCPPRHPPLHALPYPAICLLIASVHAQTSGHDTFTFEMLHETFKSQVRTSQSAPVQVEGGGIGMMRCSREVLFSAFERLIDLRIFLPAAASAANIAKEFALHRSAVDRFTIKKAVETTGQLSLKKWFTKAA